MNDKQIAEIKGRVEKAAAGPWFTGSPNREGLTAVEDGRADGLFTFYAETYEAEFCAHAREDVCALVKSVEQLKTELINSIADVLRLRDQISCLRRERGAQ